MIIATVTDSRGRTASKTMNITVVNYSSPSVNATVTRKASASSTMVVSITGSITSLSSKNIANYTIKSKLKASTDYSAKASNEPMTGTPINITKEVVTYVVGSSYDVQVIVTDKLTSTMITLTLPTDAVILDVNKNGVGIGKYRENGVLDVNADLTTIYSKGTTTLKTLIVNLVYPVGAIYLAVNNRSPATLFGGTWVQLQNRFLLGAGTSYTNGATGGSATHTLTVSEMPDHNHKNMTRGAVLNWDNNTSGQHYFGHQYKSASFGSSNAFDLSSSYVSSVGGGQKHNNMPPYLVVYMWKRTA